jgi:hypothetical protein
MPADYEATSALGTNSEEIRTWISPPCSCCLAPCRRILCGLLIAMDAVVVFWSLERKAYTHSKTAALDDSPPGGGLARASSPTPMNANGY